jgi:hypothetical protein
MRSYFFLAFLCAPLPIDRDKLCFSVALCNNKYQELTPSYTEEHSGSQSCYLSLLRFQLGYQLITGYPFSHSTGSQICLLSARLSGIHLSPI